MVPTRESMGVTEEEKLKTPFLAVPPGILHLRTLYRPGLACFSPNCGSRDLLVALGMCRASPDLAQQGASLSSLSTREARLTSQALSLQRAQVHQTLSLLIPDLAGTPEPRSTPSKS